MKLIVYDITGRIMTTLVNQTQTAGTYQVDFDGSNLSSGVYFYKLIIGGPSSGTGKEEYTETKKMVLIK